MSKKDSRNGAWRVQTQLPNLFSARVAQNMLLPSAVNWGNVYEVFLVREAWIIDRAESFCWKLVMQILCTCTTSHNYQNPRHQEGEQLFIINHIFTNNLVRLIQQHSGPKHAKQPYQLIMKGTFQKPNSHVRPRSTPQAGPSKEMLELCNIKPTVLIFSLHSTLVYIQIYFN